MKMLLLATLLAACGSAPEPARQHELAVMAAPPTDAMLAIARRGMGHVTSTPAGIDCRDDCNETYETGQVVALAAVPEAGWLFTGWDGVDCEGVAPCIVTVDHALVVTARFDEAQRRW